MNKLKAVLNDITGPYTVPTLECKALVELADGTLVDEDLHNELVVTVKATTEVLAAARQILEV